MNNYGVKCPKCQCGILQYSNSHFNPFTNTLIRQVTCLPCDHDFTLTYQCSITEFRRGFADIPDTQEEIDADKAVDIFISAEVDKGRKLGMDYGDYLQFKRIEKEKGVDISGYKVFMAYPKLSDATTDRWALEREGHKTIVRRCVKGYVLYWQE